MSDFFLQDDGNGTFDLNIVRNDIQLDAGLETAIIVSLFTDKRVTIEELPFGETDRSGWWGDLLAELETDKIGSKLWTLAREKKTEKTRTRIIEYVQEALAWLIADGIAESIDVNATYPAAYRESVEIAIAIKKPSGKVTFRYVLNWNAEAARGS